MILALSIILDLPGMLAEHEGRLPFAQEPTKDKGMATSSGPKDLLREVYSQVVKTGWVNLQFDKTFWSIGYSSSLGKGKELYSVRYDSPGGHLGPLPFEQSYLVYSEEGELHIALNPTEYFDLVKQVSPELVNLNSKDAFLALAETLPLSSRPSALKENSYSVSLQDGMVKIVRSGPLVNSSSVENAIEIEVEFLFDKAGCVSLTATFLEGKPATLQSLLDWDMYFEVKDLEAIQWDKDFGRNVGPYYSIVMREGIPIIASLAKSLETLDCMEGVRLYSRRAVLEKDGREVWLRGMSHDSPDFGFNGLFTVFPFVSLKAIEACAVQQSPNERKGWEWAITGSYQSASEGVTRCSEDHWINDEAMKENAYVWNTGAHFHGNPWGTETWTLIFEKNRLKQVIAKW